MGRHSEYIVETQFGKCPKCGGDMDCIDSRAASNHRRRRFRCKKRKCWYAYSTREVRLEDWEVMENLTARAQTILDAVKQTINMLSNEDETTN